MKYDQGLYPGYGTHEGEPVFLQGVKPRDIYQKRNLSAGDYQQASTVKKNKAIGEQLKMGVLFLVVHTHSNPENSC